MRAPGDPAGPRVPAFLRGAPAVLALLLAFAALLRLPGLFTDFWLDEIWSLVATRGMTSSLDVFRSFRVDNNHHLNTLWLYLVGERERWEIYRLPSYFAGVGTVALAWMAGRRESLQNAALAGGLTGGSFLLVLFSSEARGYSPAVFFSFAAWLLLLRFAAAPGPLPAAGFWICTVFAVLSHLTALHFVAAAAVWLVYRLWHEGRAARTLALTVWAFGVPVACIALFYLAALRGTAVGGGPAYRTAGILARTLSLVSGGPGAGAGAWVAAAGALGTLLWSLFRMARRRDDRWVFFAIVTLVSPALVLAASRPPVLFARYFIIPAAFSLLSATGLLAAGLAGGGRTRRLVILLLCGYAAGNLLHVAQFTRAGRGSFLAAVRLMERETPGGGRISIGGDYFRVPMVLTYYQRFLPTARSFDYCDFMRFPRTGTEWYVTERRDPKAPPAQAIADASGNRYDLRAAYPAAELSGASWQVYRRAHQPE